MESATPRRTASAKRPTAMQPLDVRRILTDQGAFEAKPLPTEHFTSPKSPAGSTKSTGSSGRASFHSHGRTMFIAAESMGSGNTTPARTNRFSVTFPVQPTTGETSPMRVPASPRKDVPATVPETLASPTGPTDSSFLTAIAAQERKVLELKEEWQRAEAELDKLKRSWANHEASKKRNDARKVTKLQPLNTAMSSPDKEDEGDGSSARMQQEMERRKALLHGTKTSNRTVFSGSRHTRTLSLLSPVSNNHAATIASHPPRQDSLSTKQSLDRERPPLQPRPSMLSRASTTPDMTNEVADTAQQEIDLAQANVDRELLIKTGKKMATDFKEGLWTFWEDLRQATVGDEATQTASPGMRKQASSQTLRARREAGRASPNPSSRGSSASKASTDTAKRQSTKSPVNRRRSPAKVLEEPPLVDVDGTFWTDAGLTAPGTSHAPVKKIHKHSKTLSTAPSTASSAGDAWDTWDETSPIDSRSSSATSQSTNHHNISPRKSYEPRESNISSGQVGKKEPIPWAPLSKLGPANLRRTASHLMNEWEKSMTPSPGQEFKGNAEDYMGFGAEAAALTPEKRE